MSAAARRTRHAASAAWQRGLTMIEVLAAMVVLSIGAVVLFGWIGQAASRLALLSAEQRQLFGELAALEFARGLNPMLQPSGQMRLGDAEIRWTSMALGDEQSVMGSGTSLGAYVVRLYRLVLVTEADGAPPKERSLVLAGWRQTKPVRGATPFGPAAPPAAPPAAAPITPNSPPRP